MLSLNECHVDSRGQWARNKRQYWTLSAECAKVVWSLGDLVDPEPP